MGKLPKKTAILLILVFSMNVPCQAPTTAAPKTTAAPNTAAPKTTAAPNTAAPKTTASTTAPSCADKATCASMTTDLCVYQAIVNDCPLLCHKQSGCKTNAPTTAAPKTTASTAAPCTDKASCASMNTALCIYQAIVNDCPLLCHTQSGCNPNAPCTDKASCANMNTALCIYQAIVNDCPLLCHTQSGCNPNACKDKDLCTGMNTNHCQYQAIVDDCPLLCADKSSCEPKGGETVATSFRLTDEVYNSDLADPSSDAFKALKIKVEKKVAAALKQELGGRFVKIVVNSFTSGSVVAHVDVVLAQQDTSNAIDTVLKAIKNSGIPSLVGECGDGFMNVNNQCLMFSSERLTWSAATTACGTLNGRLVVPTDFKKMADYIIKNNLFYWQYWVGASDDPAAPGTYKWLGGTLVDAGLWYTGFPLTPGTASGVTWGQSCVKLHPTTNTDNGLIAAWDTNCAGKNTYRYICEE